MEKDWVPILTRTKWRGETERYAERVASLTLVNATIVEQSKRFPGLLHFAPTPEVSVKHRGRSAHERVVRVGS